jgi:uncharacterized protein
MFTELMQSTFPVAGIKTYLFIPPLVAFSISFFTSMAGISGAFLIMPFQVSVLGFISPSVSSTNYLYNVVGTPGGIVRYVREKRMFWALAFSMISGALPGVLVGYYLRVTLLPNPRVFKFFVGIVLLCVGMRFTRDILKSDGSLPVDTPHRKSIARVPPSFKLINFSFKGDRINFCVPHVMLPALAVGIVSGIYGIGGGAILAPYLVAVLHIPVYAVAGAVLLANLFTSLAGMAFYSVIPIHNGVTAPPDWILGGLFGLGGLVGMYYGAKYQRFFPEKAIKCVLSIIIFIVSGKYIFQFF